MDALHFLVTLRCTRACPHCFVWGGPAQRAAFAVEDLRAWVGEAKTAGLSGVAFEGGEPFLHYAVLWEGVIAARDCSLRASAVTNGYWAVSPGSARAALRPLVEAGLASMMVSSDDYHGDAEDARRAALAVEIGLAMGVNAYKAETHLGDVMFRGRAAAMLARDVPGDGPAGFTSCPREALANPGRVHVDPDGNLHLCQGLILGNLRRSSLREILAGYRPREHPVVGPLLAGGPLQLARAHGLPLAERYADACELCYRARDQLRPVWPQHLGPAYLYGGR